MTLPVLPTIDEELWRYSRIGELQLDRFALGEVDTTTTGELGATGADVPLAAV